MAKKNGGWMVNVAAAERDALECDAAAAAATDPAVRRRFEVLAKVRRATVVELRRAAAVAAARDAERTLAAIARTRRPTDEETAAARAAYALAAEMSR